MVDLTELSQNISTKEVPKPTSLQRTIKCIKLNLHMHRPNHRTAKIMHAQAKRKEQKCYSKSSTCARRIMYGTAKSMHAQVTQDQIRVMHQ